MNISIIGNGFVGNAIYENMKYFYNLFVYDIDENKRRYKHRGII